MYGRTLAPLALASAILFLPSISAEAGPADIIEKMTALAEDASKKDEEKIKAAAAYLKPLKEGLDAAVEELKTKYNEAKTFFEEKKMARYAAILSVFGMGAQASGQTKAFGDIRLIFWNQVYDLARNDILPEEERQKTAVQLVTMWKPMVDDLFAEIMRQHGRHEAENNKTEMARDLKQMEILAKAAKEAFDRPDLLESVEGFKKALKEFSEMTPEQRKKMKRAQEALARAIHKHEGQEHVPARDVFLMAYRLFKELGVKRKIMIAAYWLAVAHEKTKEYWEIKGYLDEAKKLAEELGDTAKAEEIAAYWASLKKREKEGAFNLTKSPLTDPANFGPAEPAVSLQTVYGRTVDSPSPSRFEDIVFWKPLYLCDGEYQGKPGDKIKLPFPGLHYWIKHGSSVLYATNLEGRGAQRVRLSTKPVKNSVMGAYFYKNDTLNIKYEFLACLLRTVRVCERTITYPVDNTAYNIRLYSNTHRMGSFKGQQFYIGDDNCNGLFKDFATDENPNQEHVLDIKFGGADSISVGRGGRGYQTFLGTLVRFGSTYYEMKLNNPVTEVEFREYKGPMGKVVLTFNGNPRANVHHFIIGQKVGAEKIFFLNLGGTRGPVEVPVGAYFFKYGLLTSGRDPEKSIRHEILRGTYPSFKVEEGKTVEIEFGGPYKFHYPVTFDPNSAEGYIKTYEMTITGAKGEVYRNRWPKVFAPDYQVVDENGRVVDKGRMRCFSETDELEPAGIGAEILYRHPIHIKFKARPGVHQPPFKVVISTSDPLFGRVKDEKYR